MSLHCIPRQAVHDLWADLFQRQYFSANPRLRREPRHSPNYADCFILRDQSCGYGHRGSASVLWSCPMRHPDHRTPCPGAARKWNLGFRKIFLCTCLRRVINASNHTIWMNREALKEFGITRNTQKVNLCRKREKDAKRGEPTSNRHLRQQWTCSFWGQRLGPHGQYRFFRKPGISRAIKG